MISIFPLFLLFTVLPALEIFLLINVSHSLGGINTFYIVLLTGFFGAYFAKSQGRELFNKVQLSLSQGQMPTSEITEGLLVLVGGILLVTPGFITDIVGLSCIIPGPRHIIKLVIIKIFANSISVNTRFYTNQEGPINETKQVSPDTFEAEYKKK